MTASKEFTPQYVPGPHVIVYKTKSNYDKLVPVDLNDSMTQISSYPAPSDVVTPNGYATPTPLHNGYLLDNRGIGKTAAFLNMTYEEYARLPALLSPKAMLDRIVDKDPIIEMYDCGTKTAFSDVIAQLNELIDNKKLENVCRKIK